MTFLLQTLLFLGEGLLIYLGSLVAFAAAYVGLSLVAIWISRKIRPPTPVGDHAAEDASSKFVLRARMKRLAKPTLLLVPAKAPGFSKIGGLPELPRSVDWPIFEGRPAAFVAQIDIAAFRPHGGFDWLPEDGRLYMFFDDWKNGAADSAAILYSKDVAGAAREPPSGLPAHRRFSERRVGFMRCTSFPSADWLGRNWPAGLDLEHWEFAKDADFGDEIEHRIGGYPGEIQGGQMAVECEYLWRGLRRDLRQPVPDEVRRAARQWRLLLQIDSDPALGMNWWDAGRLYVFIRARDAKRGDFSKTVTITQTY